MAHTHTVQAGDSLIRIAHQYGFLSWETIWDLPANDGLRSIRTHPHLLVPGDVVVIPEKTPFTFDCAVAQRHTFTLKTLEATLRLMLHDAVGERLDGVRYELTLKGQDEVRSGTVEGGVLAVRVPPDSTEGTLALFIDEEQLAATITYTLRISQLQPPGAPEGARQRLRNLGYWIAEGEDKSTAASGWSVRSFQQREGLSATAVLDDATIERITDMHGV